MRRRVQAMFEAKILEHRTKAIEKMPTPPQEAAEIPKETKKEAEAEAEVEVCDAWSTDQESRLQRLERRTAQRQLLLQAGFVPHKDFIVTYTEDLVAHAKEVFGDLEIYVHICTRMHTHGWQPPHFVQVPSWSVAAILPE
uniref:Uncharacterized protein n=1 Tax=Palpitomonas bilix TaxID=652834 RepID=A0A7S3GKK0_9EUKA|mmetsp:Transcript_7230/g.18780  ORF Transcript_7230/g.18780 Transcript_7230/m.18780 type:complete len:140 (+) Transcript_7230:592-1011(+)